MRSQQQRRSGTGGATGWTTPARGALRAACALTVGCAALAAAAAPLNLYEWIGVAPTIVTAESLGANGRFTEIRILEVLRGERPPDPVVRVDVRRANRERNRNSDSKALRLETGTSYVLLLQRAPSKDKGPMLGFDLMRGVNGARELPAEGSAAYVDALLRFIEIQDHKDDLKTWVELREMLEETQPMLIETALDQFLKFRRGDAELLQVVRPLLDHPAQRLRERAVKLIGQILVLAESRQEPIPDADTLKNELVGRARRDSSVPVRMAATLALNGLRDERVSEILEEIAEDDPDQRVRYAAEKAMFDRRRRHSDRGGGDAEGGAGGS